MSRAAEAEKDVAPVVTRSFVGRRAETEEALSRLSEESQAGLRQYSLERMLGYGVDYADAIELRGRVLEGHDWRQAATELAETALNFADNALGAGGAPTRIACLRRASALLRISQTLMVTDSPERSAIFARAADLYGRAAELTRDRQPVLIDTDSGKLAGWLVPAAADAVASTILIGGVEGWAMDFDSMSDALAARGVETLALDGPGQGETRMIHRHFLSTDWPAAYRGAIDFFEKRAPGRPIGFIGNSMGGSFAMAVAAADQRIRACCNNGGPFAPGLVPPQGTFFAKMMTMCNASAPEQATEIWSSVVATQAGPNAGYPLLMVQGGEDPLVSNELSDFLFANAPTEDKQMVVFSDGDHCIYRHKQDRDILISDWMRARLSGQSSPEDAT